MALQAPAGGIMPPTQTRAGQLQQRIGAMPLAPQNGTPVGAQTPAGSAYLDKIAVNSGGIMPPGMGSPVPGYKPPSIMPVPGPQPVTDGQSMTTTAAPQIGRGIDQYQTPGIMPPRNTGIVPPGMGQSAPGGTALADALASVRPGQPRPAAGASSTGNGVPQVTPPSLPNYQPQALAAPQVAAPNYQGAAPSVPQISATYNPVSAPNPTASTPAPNYQGAAISAPTVGASQASAQMFDMASFRPFADAVTNEAKRALDPRFQEEEAAFRQRMVNQGIQEGTQAYDTAFANFSRAKNDAYSSAQNQALAQALGAQNQMFGQSFQNASLQQQAGLANAQNALQAAGLGQADRQFGANLGQQYNLANAQNALQAFGLNQADRQFGANLGMAAQQQNASNALQAAGLGQADRQFGANLGQQGALANQQALLQMLGLGQADRQFGANFGLQGAQLNQQGQLANQAAWLQKFGLDQNQNQFNQNLGQRESEFGRTFGEGQRQFDQNFGFQGQRADMADLMALLGYGQQTTAANNAALTADQQRAGALFGLIPGLAPTQLDVMGPANSLLNAQNANNQAAAASQNGVMGAIGQLGAAGIMLSDRRAKTDIKRVGTLDNGLPVYLYRYKTGGPAMLGLMADEVEGVRPDAVVTLPDGLQAVNYAEAVK